MFPATLHRVVIPEEEVLQKKARQSIVFFLHPESSALVQPLISKGAQSKAQTYHPITALDHVNKRFAATYQYWNKYMQYVYYYFHVYKHFKKRLKVGG